MNSSAARRNSSRPTNPARMRLLASLEARCHVCETNPATLREPTGKNGGYRSICLDCLYTAEDYDVLEELLDLLDSI